MKRDAHPYVLGQSSQAARRLEIQDAHFAEPSELLLDDLQLRPSDRVVELGCGAGSFSRRVLRRLGRGGVLVGVDASAGLLEQAQDRFTNPPAHSTSPLAHGECRTDSREPTDAPCRARFERVLADIGDLGPWLDEADVVTARTVLHHVPMAEFMLGRLRARLKPGTRIGFLEPDFRIPLARLAYLEATGRPELAALRQWAVAINQLYQAIRMSPDIGGTLAQTLEYSGYRDVRSAWTPCPSNAVTLENMLMFYDEVRERLQALGIMSAAVIDEQRRLLRSLSSEGLPPVWGSHRAVCTA